METILRILVGLAVLLTSLQVVLTWRTTRRRRPFGAGLHEQASSSDSRPVDFTTTPRLSILKPICGLDDGLRDNLRSFAEAGGLWYELILSIADPRDSAIPLVEEILQEFPAAPFRLVVGGPVRTPNPKVERLIAAAEWARGEILMVSDSNIRVSPGDITRTLREFDDPATGCVSNPFVGEGASTFGATMESLHLLTFVLPGCALAAAFETPCVVGKSMALRRETLERIGGFEAFGEILAEDQAIGLAVREAGYRVVLSPVVMRNVVVSRPLQRALARQVRWNKIRYAFSRMTYLGEFLLNPLPLAFITIEPGLIAAVVLIRLFQTLILARATGSTLPAWRLLLAPVQDMIQFGAQFLPFFSKQVEWRGHRARLGPGTQMEIEDLAAA